MTERKCTKCKQLLSLSEFYEKRSENRYFSWCITCWNEYQSSYYHKTKRSSHRLLKRATPGWIATRLEKLEYKCELCREPLDISDNYQVHVDHCHITKKKRGILCRKCNTGLGMFNDDPEQLRRAAKYIEFFAKQHGRKLVVKDSGLSMDRLIYDLGEHVRPKRSAA